MTSLAIGNGVIINNLDLHVNDTDLASKIYLIPALTPLYPPRMHRLLAVLILFIHSLLLLSLCVFVC